MGKSAFLLNVGLNAAAKGARVLYVTLEDKQRYQLMRAMSRHASVDLWRIRMRLVKDNEFGPLLMAINDLSKLPFWVLDRHGMISTEVCQEIALHRERHGLDYVVVDHLGHIADKGEFYEVASRACRMFADLASEMNLPLTLAVQLSREVEKRTDKRPQLSDLRDSGRIEEYARDVWMLYRPAYYDPSAPKDKLDLYIPKAAHGRTGKVSLSCALEVMHIDDPKDERKEDY
jgi:replicative DNA helicase